MQSIGDTEWLQILDLAHQVADLPECDRSGFMSTQELDAEMQSLVLELAADFEPAPEFGVGSQLGRYEATAEIGRGATSQIFSAIDRDLGRNVALKVLNSEGAGEDDALGSLLREARAASALSHPNIVTVFEVVRSGRLTALAMEYVPGMPLRSMMRRPLKLRECLPVWRQAATALEAAHHAGIAHRDMKPENILVRPDGLVKILDFGMAHSPAHDADWEMTSGTPRYMSPEQCRSTRIGVETDIFSLGVVFYEMITGRCPFEGGSAWDTMTSIVEDAPEPPSKWNPAIHRQLDALILSMLRKKAAGRPTAGQVTESLERLTRATLGAPAVWATVENMVSRAAAWVSKPVHAIWRGLSVASGRTSSAVPTPLLD